MMDSRTTPHTPTTVPSAAGQKAVSKLASAHKGQPEEAQTPGSSRRRFIKTLSYAAALVATLPWRAAYAKKVGLALAQVPALEKVGGSTIVTIKGQELLIIRDTAHTVKALDPMCTHKKCKVFYRPKDNDIGCKCHKSKFTLEGKRVSGPAPRPLGRFPAKIKGDKIIISLS